MTVYREVKFFDLRDAPEFIRDAIRPVALAHISTVGGDLDLGGHGRN